jgi:hypothetical protein
MAASKKRMSASRMGRVFSLKGERGCSGSAYAARVPRSRRLGSK